MYVVFKEGDWHIIWNEQQILLIDSTCNPNVACWSLHASPGFHFVQLKLILIIYMRIGIHYFLITWVHWVGTIPVRALFQLRQNCCIAAILNALVMGGALGMLNKVHLHHGQIMLAVYRLFYVVIMEPQAHIAQFIPHKCMQCNVLKVAIHLLDQ